MNTYNSCEEYLPLIHLYLDDELSRDEQAELFVHLEHCEACAALLADYRLLAGEMRALPQTPPLTLHRDIMAHIQKNTPLPWWRRNAFRRGACAVACAAMICLVVWTNLSVGEVPIGPTAPVTTAATASSPAQTPTAIRTPMNAGATQAATAPPFSDAELALDGEPYDLTGQAFSGAVAAVGDLSALPAFPGWERTIVPVGEGAGCYLLAYGIDAREHACVLLAAAGFTLYDRLASAPEATDEGADCWLILLAQED